MKLAHTTPENSQENLVEMIDSLQKKLAEKAEIIQQLNHQLYLFRNAKFGRKSEKQTDDSQGVLFDEEELELEPNTPEEEKETITYTRSKKRQTKSLPKSMPYVEKVYDLTEAEKVCDCGCELTHIKDDITEQLDVLPQVCFRVVNIQKKYACKACDGTIQKAKKDEAIIERSIATPGLLAAIIDAKFNRHLPLYRQEQIFSDMGTPISRAVMSTWLINISEHLTPLIKLLHDHILNYDIAYADETPLKVLKQPDKRKSINAYMWLFIGGPPDKRSFIYQYHPTRSNQVAEDFFEDFKGYIHADCYSAYTSLDKKYDDKHHIACNAHARRGYVDVANPKKKKGIAHQIINLYKELYKVEKDLKEKQATINEIYKARQSISKPLIQKMKTLIDEAILKTPPKSPLGKALAYSIKHWGALIKYLDDGRLEIDNNRAERSIKPFVIGRKGWLFHGNHKGAQAGSQLYSLIETCKAHKIDVFAYFKFILANIKKCQNIEDFEKLLPFNVSKSELAEQRVIPKLIYPE